MIKTNFLLSRRSWKQDFFSTKKYFILMDISVRSNEKKIYLVVYINLSNFLDPTKNVQEWNTILFFFVSLTYLAQIPKNNNKINSLFVYFFQFLCTQNIKIFLDTCKNHFGLKETDLFDPSMLYDLTNFHRVLITISKLSQCRKVLSLHPNLR